MLSSLPAASGRLQVMCPDIHESWHLPGRVALLGSRAEHQLTNRSTAVTWGPSALDLHHLSGVSRFHVSSFNDKIHCWEQRGGDHTEGGVAREFTYRTEKATRLGRATDYYFIINLYSTSLPVCVTCTNVFATLCLFGAVGLLFHFWVFIGYPADRTRRYFFQGLSCSHSQI